MRSLFSLLFSAWFLLGSFMPGNDAEELVKIPSLIQHYQEHCKAKPGGSFADFLSEHYGDAAPSGKEHQELPFVKHLQPCLVFVLPAFNFCLAPNALHSLPPAVFPELPLNLLAVDFRPWQPPQEAV